MAVTATTYNYNWNEADYATLEAANSAAVAFFAEVDSTPSIHTFLKRVLENNNGMYTLGPLLTDADILDNPTGLFICNHYHDSEVYETQDVAAAVAKGKQGMIDVKDLNNIRVERFDETDEAALDSNGNHPLDEDGNEILWNTEMSISYQAVNL